MVVAGDVGLCVNDCPLRLVISAGGKSRGKSRKFQGVGRKGKSREIQGLGSKTLADSEDKLKPHKSRVLSIHLLEEYMGTHRIHVLSFPGSRKGSRNS